MTSHRFWIVLCLFSFVSRYFFISSLISPVTYWLFSSMLFRLHLFGVFCSFFFLLVNLVLYCCGQKDAWKKKMLDMISVFLNFLRLVLWPSMWSILENVPCALEKNVYSAVFGWSILHISINSIWSNVSFKASVSLLIFCLNHLSIDVSGGVKVPYYYCITVNFSLYIC